MKVELEAIQAFSKTATDFKGMAKIACGVTAKPLSICIDPRLPTSWTQLYLFAFKSRLTLGVPDVLCAVPPPLHLSLIPGVQEAAIPCVCVDSEVADLLAS
jgi:hypothetical protein